MLLASLLGSLPIFCHFTSFPQADCAFSGIDSQVGGLVWVLESHGPLQWTLLWDWELLLLPQPPQVFTVRGFEVLVSHARTLGCPVCLSPQLLLLTYSHVKVEYSSLPSTTLPACDWQPLACRVPSLPWLLISAPPTSLDEYFFFNSLAVGLS